MINKKLLVIVFICAFCLIPNLTLAKVKLSLKLRGGFNYILAGWVNSIFQDKFNYYKIFSSDWTQVGDYKALHYGVDSGSDFIINFNRHWGLGIGVSYVGSVKTSRLTQSERFVGYYYKHTLNLKLWALPIRLSLFYIKPLGNRFNFTASVGGEFYPTIQYHYFWYTEENGNIGMYTQWFIDEANLHRVGLGVVCTLGFEYNMFHTVDFFIDAQGRYARFNGGFMGEYVIGDGINSFQEIIHIKGVRINPIIDLSGVSLQAGIRIHF